ncbi:SCO2521 family protein [Kitasatospora sp. NPDC048365]|uniref:SCO2521 family protein n=1 Tax=Kitasatospora sp. NPDC048365 TaxID=3364050 RepID=UPI0037230CBF
MRPDRPGEGPALLLGEVRTGLLQHSVELPGAATEKMLGLRHGGRVRSSQRPNVRAQSPDLLTGVDCPLATTSHRAVRGVGTVLSHAVLTEGRVLQASALARIAAGGDRRRPWGHYLAHPGTVEVIGRGEAAELAAGHLAAAEPGTGLDLGGLTERLLTEVQREAGLDRRAPFRSRRTRLRWTAVRADLAGEEPGGRLTVEDDTRRTLRLTLESVDPVEVAAFCEDLALHDWLLSTLGRLIERSGLGSDPGPGPVQRLRPAVNHLMHLWMPGARVARPLAPLWEGLETRPGFTRQWTASVQRVRDHLALQAVGLTAPTVRGD